MPECRDAGTEGCGGWRGGDSGSGCWVIFVGCCLESCGNFEGRVADAIEVSDLGWDSIILGAGGAGILAEGLADCSGSGDVASCDSEAVLAIEETPRWAWA